MNMLEFLHKYGTRSPGNVIRLLAMQAGKTGEAYDVIAELARDMDAALDDCADNLPATRR